MSDQIIWTRKEQNCDFHIMAMEFLRGEQISMKRLSLSWTPEGAVILSDILERAARSSGVPGMNLPFTSLRPMFEMMLDNLAWLNRDMSLSLGALRAAERNAGRLEFGHADMDIVTKADVLSGVRTALDLWVTLHLTPYCAKYEVEDELDEIKSLLRDNRLFSSMEVEAKLPVPDVCEGNFFSLAPQYLGRLLEGIELFEGMGPVRRIVQNKSTGNSFKLVTFPRAIEHRSGHAAFSMTADISIESQPFRAKPILKVTARKSRWLDRTRSVPKGMNEIGGLVFPAGGKPVAIPFSLFSGKGDERWPEWQIDRALLDQMAARCGVPHIENVEGLVSLPVDPSQGWAGVNYTSRFSYSHPIGGGVSERDEAELAERVRVALDGVVGEFMTGDQVKISSRGLPSRATPVMRLEEYLATHNDDEDENKAALGKTLSEAFPSIAEKDVDALEPKKIRGKEIEQFWEMNREIIKHLHGDDRPALWLIAKSPKERKLMRWAAESLFGNTIDLFDVELPVGAHGPWVELSKKKISPRDRFAERVEKWKATTDAITKRGQVSYVIVQAEQEYPIPNSKRTRDDDSVNRVAGIHALAKNANSNVHYLLPPHGLQSSDGIIEYLQRFQAAAFDLMYAHNAYTVGVKEIINKAFPNDGAPKEILGISLVRGNRGYRKPGQNSTIGYLARTNVETGRSDLALAYREKSGLITITPWMNFSEGLRYAASQTHMTLGRQRTQVEEGFQKLIEKAIGESCRKGNNPLVMIDVSAAKGQWPWLNDANMDIGNIKLNELQQHMEDDWIGARIVRVRANASALQIKACVNWDAQSFDREGHDTGDRQTYKSWSTRKAILNTTAPNNGGYHYLAVFGYPNTSQFMRNLSGYHEVQVMKALAPKDKSDKISGKQYRFAADNAVLKHLPTPNTIDLTVAFLQSDDDPNLIAWACNELRYDHAHTDSRTTLPAPLFYENKLRTDYMILLKIEEAERGEQGGS
ncbi:MAG: RNaseH domain-containing protein [Alphaproteobacteria bacterium]|nr:RNaseH domain-containing protein [Alphaproteobacteria bacterium]